MIFYLTHYLVTLFYQHSLSNESIQAWYSSYDNILWYYSLTFFEQQEYSDWYSTYCTVYVPTYEIHILWILHIPLTFTQSIQAYVVRYI